MTKTRSIGLYRLLIRLYPKDFRQRFGEEMLWTFEQCAPHESGARLVVDGVFSVARQRWEAQFAFDSTPSGFCCELSARRPAMMPWVLAAVLSCAFLAGISTLSRPLRIKADVGAAVSGQRIYPLCHEETISPIVPSRSRLSRSTKAVAVTGGER